MRVISLLALAGCALLCFDYAMQPNHPTITLRSDGLAIRYRRLEAGLTASQVAERVGVHRGTISNVEMGRRTASPALLRELADLFGCDVADLVREVEVA